MTSAELLAATGNIWEAACFKDGNGRIFLGRWYIRSATREKARTQALRRSGGRHAVLWPWDPRKDLQASQYISVVPDVAQVAQHLPATGGNEIRFVTKTEQG